MTLTVRSIALIALALLLLPLQYLAAHYQVDESLRSSGVVLGASAFFEHPLWYVVLGAVVFSVYLVLLTGRADDARTDPLNIIRERCCILAGILTSGMGYVTFLALPDFAVWSALCFDGLMVIAIVVRILWSTTKGGPTDLRLVVADAKAERHADAV